MAMNKVRAGFAAALAASVMAFALIGTTTPASAVVILQRRLGIRGVRVAGEARRLLHAAWLSPRLRRPLSRK